jgi:hypothetical protein
MRGIIPRYLATSGFAVLKKPGQAPQCHILGDMLFCQRMAALMTLRGSIGVGCRVSA